MWNKISKLWKKQDTVDIRTYTLSKKIDLLMKKQDINFYTPDYRNTFLDFIESDIVKYDKILVDVLRQGLETKFVTIRDITQNSYQYKSFSFWYSNNDNVLETKAEYKKFLYTIFNFTKWYEEAKVQHDNTTLLNNVRRLTPYYYNIEQIVNTILEIEGMIKKEVE